MAIKRPAIAGIGFIVGILGLFFVWGIGGHFHHIFGGRSLPPAADARTLEILATDFAFAPAEISVRVREPVNLRLINRGAVTHELTLPSQSIHLVVQAGQHEISGLKTDRPGEFEFLCGVPGHREAGMVGRIIVTP